jgi:hypothetical protein
MWALKATGFCLKWTVLLSIFAAVLYAALAGVAWVTDGWSPIAWLTAAVLYVGWRIERKIGAH